MNPRGRLVGGLVLAAVALSGAAGRGDKTPDRRRYDSPEAVFQASQAALRKNDIRAFMACLTADSQTLLTGQVAYGALMLKGVAALDRTGKAAEKVKPVNEVFARHGLTEAKVKKLDLSRDPKDTGRSMRAIGGMVKDQPAFAAELVAALGKATGPRAEKTPAAGRLTGLKVAGDRATGTVLSSKDDKETRTPIRFVRVEGGWKIVLPEPEAKRDPEQKPPAGKSPKSADGR